MAAYQNEGRGVLVIKGISDWADPAKEDGWRQYAEEAAAAFLVALLKSAPYPSKESGLSFESSRSKLSAAGDRNEPDVRYTGKSKVDVCDRLANDWYRLADFFEVPPHERRGFPNGREPQSVWEWLEQRSRLGELPEGLKLIGREDLLKSLISR